MEAKKHTGTVPHISWQKQSKLYIREQSSVSDLQSKQVSIMILISEIIILQRTIFKRLKKKCPSLRIVMFHSLAKRKNGKMRSNTSKGRAINTSLNCWMSLKDKLLAFIIREISQIFAAGPTCLRPEK